MLLWEFDCDCTKKFVKSWKIEIVGM